MTLGQEIVLLKKQVQELKSKLEDLVKNTEEKLNKPYSKVGINRLMSNFDRVFDGITGIWKNYAVYKDEEE